jgi:hypothetical protein
VPREKYIPFLLLFCLFASGVPAQPGELRQLSILYTGSVGGALTPVG